MKDKNRNSPKAFLIAVHSGKGSHVRAEESLEELSLLASTAGYSVCGSALQNREKPDPASYIGSGKAAVIKEEVTEQGISTLIFDDDLSGSQIRNIEELTGAKVTDRSGLIIDIFGRRARSREALLQVELAKEEYMLPRLVGLWTHLEKQRGAVGVRSGPGEKVYETDRRKIKTKISDLKKEIASLTVQRDIKRAGRYGYPVIAVTGYTNAGKSTLINRLTGSALIAENKLFATLDPFIRKLTLDGRKEALLVDTVGFIRKLPPQLIAAFRSTLDEIRFADLILKVVDVTDENFDEKLLVVGEILNDLGAASKKSITVFNKADLYPDKKRLENIIGRYENSIAISSLKGYNISALTDKITEADIFSTRAVTVSVKAGDPAARSLLYKNSRVIREECSDGEIFFDIEISAGDLARIRKKHGASLRFLNE